MEETVMKDVLGYEDKAVVVTGAASGMGEAAARILVGLGAEVYALDVKEVSAPVKQFIKMDLKGKDSIGSAAELIPDEIYSLFNCAGILGPPFSDLDTTLINFVGPRHLTEMLLPRITDGGAIAFISSTAGMGWQGNLDNVNKLLAAQSFDEARAWLEGNPKINNGYMFSKQCITAYIKTKAGELAGRDIRINCISPAPTDTPFMKDLFDQFGKEAADLYLAPCGRYATPAEMAEPLIFINSNMARFVSGHDLVVDFGYAAEVETGQRENLLGL
jgi:NAD(P)-dependent dehydrogenase (short-subunit alcohol dehydrogenase family)